MFSSSTIRDGERTTRISTARINILARSLRQSTTSSPTASLSTSLHLRHHRSLTTLIVESSSTEKWSSGILFVRSTSHSDRSRPSPRVFISRIARYYGADVRTAEMPAGDEPQPCCKSCLSIVRAFTDLCHSAVKAFDCLYVKNNEGRADSLLDVKLKIRKEALSIAIPNPIPGRFEIGFTSKGSTTTDIRVALEKIIEERSACSFRVQLTIADAICQR